MAFTYSDINGYFILSTIFLYVQEQQNAALFFAISEIIFGFVLITINGMAKLQIKAEKHSFFEVFFREQSKLKFFWLKYRSPYSNKSYFLSKSNLNLYTEFKSAQSLSREHADFFIPILYDANTKQANKLVSLLRIHLQGLSITPQNGFL